MEIPDHEHHHAQRKAIANRLSRIEGHVRKIKEMIEDNRDCPDILIQLAAVRSAINKTGQAVLEDRAQVVEGTRTVGWPDRHTGGRLCAGRLDRRRGRPGSGRRM